MSIAFSTFKDNIEPKLHGTSLAKVSTLFAKAKEAAGNVRMNVKPPTLIRSSRIENAIYDKVTNYAVNADVEMGSIIDVRPIAKDRRSRVREDTHGNIVGIEDDTLGSFMKEFDLKKPPNSALIEYINGAKTLRLSKVLNARTILHRLDSLTGEGTITLGGDASGAVIDTLDYISGSGSLKFALDGVTGVGTILIALDSAIDLSKLEDVGALFEWLKMPDISRLTSVDLEWGSSSTVYWNETVTAFHDKTFTENGDNAWGLFRHDWVDASETGSPDSDDAAIIDHLKITINYSTGAAIANVRLDNITAALGEAWEVVYYSSYMFTDSTGATWKEIPTANGDLIQLDSDGLNLFTAEYMLAVQQELKGKNMVADLAFFRNLLHGTTKQTGAYELFMDKFPDQSVVRQVEYYEFGNLDGY